MLLPNAKKAATIIVERLKDGVQHEQKPEVSTQPELDAPRASAEPIMAAFQNKSSQDLAVALEAFIKALFPKS